MSNLYLKKCGLFAVVAMMSVSAYAIPTSTVFCSGVCTTNGEDWSTNGVLWTLSGDAISGVDDSGTFTLSADVSGWNLGSTAYLAEFSLKNFGADATLSNLVAPSGTTWDVLNAGLSANGCKTNTTADALCVFNETMPLDTPNTDADFSFTFDIDLLGGLMPDFTHLKVRWVDGQGNKVGDLISQDIAWSVPEPDMVGLLAIGLLSMVVTRRKMKV